MPMSKRIKEFILFYMLSLGACYGAAILLSFIACGLANNPGRWEYHFLTTVWFIPEVFILFNIFAFATVCLTELIMRFGKKVVTQ